MPERIEKADKDEEKDGEGEDVEKDCAQHEKDGVMAHGGRAMPVARAGGCGRRGVAGGDLDAQQILLVKSKRAEGGCVLRRQRAQTM